MKTSSRNVLYALIATVLFSACSRPYATYQKMPVEHFASQKPKTAPVLTTETALPETAQTVAVTPSESQPVAALSPASELNQVQKAVDQVVASSENKVVNNKLQKRMARIQSMLGSQSSQSTEKVAAAKKPNLVEKLMLKNVDKKIKRALAPNHPNAPKAVNILVTIGAIVALLGLILWLATTSTGIGITLLIAGVILLLVGLIV
ncbi:hypothetical protein [Larkinella terrae]|uniref:Uncharacterized protein n=1 Tax=Larkinella terrae TaxID=2025311 RepID=A0A7K0EVI9_9BACT|nr:hypothetical protein [Larkinella terrae]MRS65511.1 hypothetical protein [Larkinella terrae]